MPLLDFEKYYNVKDHNSMPDDLEIWVPIR